MPTCSAIICDLFYYLHIKMDTKDIIIICEAVLLAVLLIVLVAVIVRGNGQFFGRKTKGENTQLQELARRRQIHDEEERILRETQIATKQDEDRQAEEAAALTASLARQAVAAANQNYERAGTRRDDNPYPGPGLFPYIMNTLTGGPSERNWWNV